eukprot:scaffold281_cov318-Pavlova_lutheri.AAC.15
MSLVALTFRSNPKPCMPSVGGKASLSTLSTSKYLRWINVFIAAGIEWLFLLALQTHRVLIVFAFLGKLGWLPSLLSGKCPNPVLALLLLKGVPHVQEWCERNSSVFHPLGGGARVSLSCPDAPDSKNLMQSTALILMVGAVDDRRNIARAAYPCLAHRLLLGANL